MGVRQPVIRLRCQGGRRRNNLFATRFFGYQFVKTRTQKPSNWAQFVRGYPSFAIKPLRYGRLANPDQVRDLVLSEICSVKEMGK